MKKYFVLKYILLCFLSLFNAGLVNAEIITDGSAGLAGKINLKGPDYEIRSEYGHQAGPNLFHSFETFNIGNQETAVFTGPDSVQNIITRVTGGSPSMIDGLLRSLIPEADLYFLNPAGIVFGPDASINLEGSFHVSTADYLKMGKDDIFYSSPMENEVLSISPPSAFGFLDNKIEPITFDGCNIKSLDETLSVISGDISIKNNAVITLNGGRLNLAGLSSKGEVKIKDSGIDVSAFTSLGDINITGNPEGIPSTVDVRYGSIFIRAGRFVSDNSEIRADMPYSTQNNQASVFDIQADSIEIKNNSLFSTDTFGRINGSDLLISAKESIDISDSIIRAGSIGSKASADAGRLLLQAGNITLKNNTLIQSESKDRSTGRAGNVNIKAYESVILSESSINTFTTGKGSAGNVSIDSSSIILKNNSFIKTESQAQGMAGDISVNADNLSLEGRSSLSSAGTAQNNGGDAGNISINAENSVKLSENSSLKTSAESSGGGRIQIDAGNSLLLMNSEMTTSVNKGEQKGGDIRIGSETTGSGPEIVFLNQARITANADKGDGGAIFITAENFIKSNDSLIDASSKRGNDGIIKIYTPETDISASLLILPDNYMDASQWVKTPCLQRTAENISRFVIKERDGIPFTFDDWLPSQLAVISYQLSKDSLYFIDRGDFTGLVNYLEKGSRIEIGDNILLSCAYNILGHHKKSLKILYDIMPVVEKSGNLSDKILFYNTLGDQFLSLGNIEGAITYIKDALNLAKAEKYPLMNAGALNNLGNIRAVNRDYDGAVRAYNQCLEQVELNNEFSSLRAKVLINKARAEFESGNYEDALISWEKALSDIRKTPENWHKASDMISLARLGIQINYHLDKNHITHDFAESIENNLLDAVYTGETIQDHRIVSYARGLLGQWFEKNKKYQQAVDMTRKAIFSAHQVYAPEILYQWQWQLGRLFAVSGDIDQAVKSYKNAVNTLNPIRLEYFNGFRAGTGSLFENMIRPVYIELSELLMQENSGLAAARDTLDMLKTAELQDFYQDECLSSHELNKNWFAGYMPPETALIYPVLLSDHLSLLVTFPDTIKRFMIQVKPDYFKNTIRRFREELEDEHDFLDNSSRIYEWLIRPLEKELASYAVNTIIFAPDGVLRLIPFSTLYDGKHFLVEKYALGLVPAMNLTNLSQARKVKYQVLINGLSEARHGFAPLENVKNEVENIQKIIGGKVLLNKDFTTQNLITEFQKKSYNIVHLATHAVFGASPQETFLLSYDDKLTINKLDMFVRSGQYKGVPLDLLTLSACETASGNERAAFGLAGAALKAGAKSTLATLWETDDRAAFLAVDEFYRQLAVPGTSKAKALQNAQKKIISHLQYKHPSYWAPFLLIGNWL